MTTIAYKDGILACDSQITTQNDVVIGYSNKIIELEKEVICGAGHVAAIQQFVSWYIKGADTDKIPLFLGDGCICFVINKETVKIKKYIQGQEYPNTPNIMNVTGSGMEIAIGAMAHGATAKEAVEIACKYDIGTGGEINIYDFNKKANR